MQVVYSLYLIFIDYICICLLLKWLLLSRCGSLLNGGGGYAFSIYLKMIIKHSLLLNIIIHVVWQITHLVFCVSEEICIIYLDDILVLVDLHVLEKNGSYLSVYLFFMGSELYALVSWGE